jgi:3-dehydroquinate synthase
MYNFVLDSGLGYEIKLSSDAAKEINTLITQENVFLITDSNIARIYREKLQVNYSPARTYILKPGEKAKSLKVAEKICRAMMYSGADRQTTVVALGGGVTGDLAGFCASVFMRGVPYVQIPTTLLSMVDSSVGGKTGVDLDGRKNMVGSFKQPSSVIIDFSFLDTLPHRQLTSGFGEIIKTALLDAELFDYVSENIMGLITLNLESLKAVVERCLKVKASVVARDEREAGIRKTLNAGHTIGHAMETLFNFRESHGEYVSSGLYYELVLALILGVVDKDYAKLVFKLLDKAQPERIRLPKKRVHEFLEIMTRDKKNKNSQTVFMLPVSKGEVREHSIPESLMPAKIDEVLNYES